jgi:hypothetical protein
MAMDDDRGQPGKLRFKALGRVENKDVLLVFELQFVENGGHGFP